MALAPQKPLRQIGQWPRGELVTLTHRSGVLASNPWGDPAEREVKAWLPPGCRDSDQWPVLWYLAAYTNSGAGSDNWNGFKENLPQRLDRLFAQGKLPPVVVVFPDGFTSLGGNQYLDSPGVGLYSSYIHDELIGLVEQQLPVRSGPEFRGVLGKSSGGYAALVYGMRKTEHWAAIASHAGDCGFDWVYKPDFPIAAQALTRYGGDIERYLRWFWQAKKPGGADFMALMMCGLAATYDGDAANPGHIVLPFDQETLELDSTRWDRWLSHDPLLMAARHGHQLNRLKAVFIDCGTRDQYRIQYGTRRLIRSLRDQGVELTYEEFDGTHSGIDYRLDQSLPFLAKALSTEDKLQS
ncbi:MAG: esterase [Lysobacteraceae bacterium]|nr:MAG: esterase [Xanthomonadaceae bacterium]